MARPSRKPFPLILLAALAAGTAQAASTGDTSLLRVTGSQGGTGFGDYVSDADALSTTYRFFVEVPPGTSQLSIDLFDADVGAGGSAEDAANRDRLRNAFNTSTAYRLFQPNGTQVTTGSSPPLQFATGSATAPAGADNAWLSFYTRANPPAGHWRIEIDSSSAVTAGDDVNAFGLRAHDGNAGAGGTELNVYADNLLQIGINPVPGTGSRSSVFTLHPYATHGCAVEANDFDSDDDNALTVGGQVQRSAFANRDGGFTASLTGLSANNAWTTDNLVESATFGGEGPSGTVFDRNGGGIWTWSFRVNEVSGDNANFVTLYAGEAAATAATPPTANPEAGAWRLYLPRDDAGAPLKPWLAQRYFYGGVGPNPPQNNQATRLDVVIEVVNPSAHPITFSSTNAVSSRVGGTTNAGAVYNAGSAVFTQGGIVSQPANGATGLVVWNPGTVAAGSSARLTYQVSVTPTGGGDTTNRRINGEGSSAANDNTHGTRATFTDETGAQSYTINGLCGLYYRRGTAIIVPVTLSWVSAARGADGRLALEWRTDSEFRHAGFDVFGRRANGSWTRLTAAPVAGAGDTLEPRDYALRIDAPADVDAIALEDIAADGRRTRHPAVALGTTWGRRVDAPRTDWAALRAAQRNAPRGASGAAWIEVDRDGIHRLSLADLAGAGQDLRGTPVAALALVGPDGPLPIHVESSGPLVDDATRIEFVGAARRSLYGSANRYRLLSDAGAARRLLPASAPAGNETRERDRYWHDAVLARDLQYSFAIPAADPWFDTRLLAFAGAPVEASFEVVADRIADAAGASVAIALSGGNDFPAVALDHRIEAFVNGVAVGSHAFDGLNEARVRFELPPGVLREGANPVRLRLPADHGVDFDIVQVESVALRYLRRLDLDGGALAADLGEAGDSEPSSPLLLRDGFDGPDPGCGGDGCAALAIASGTPAVAIVLGPDGGRRRAAAPVDGRIRLALADTAGGTLHVAPQGAVPAPRLLPATAPAATPQVPLDFLIVAHPQFIDALQPLVDARRAEGLATAVVDVEAIYARHSSGLPDPAAIRAHLALAHASGARYALLVGADTYDYKDHLGSGAISFLPTAYAATGDVVRHAPADPLLGDVDGDDVADLAVGRWPVRTRAEADLLVAKTLTYATAPHAGRALFVAGGSEPALDFAALSGSLAAALPAGWNAQQVTVDALGAAGARGALAAAVNAGTALVNFVGHSAVDRWTFDPLLTGNDAEALFGNAGAPTVVSQWGCWSSWFVSPTSRSLAERLLLDADGGAAAVVGAATLVETSGTDAYLAGFLRDAGAVGGARDGMRLGDALQAMRRGVASDGPGRRDLSIGIHLLGDPTLRLRR
jgi:hypothetical protein